MPDWPCLRNGRKGGSKLFFATLRRVLNARNDSGIGWPANRIKSGFGSNKSTWLGPPDMNRKMTARARGGKCGGRDARGFGTASSVEGLAANRPSQSNSDVSARRPKPPPAQRKKSRREAERTPPKTGPEHWLIELFTAHPTATRGRRRAQR